jgi:para-nitrobenzyl esterase
MKRNTLHAAIVFLVLAFVITPAHAGDPSHGFSAAEHECRKIEEPAVSVVRHTQYGKIMGIKEPDKSGLSWLGVPYAKPPVGNLRWQPPEEPDPWHGVLRTQTFGNACAQVGEMYGPPGPGGNVLTLSDTFFQRVGEEDCLYMNIFRPATKEEDLPVWVYIHGGSNRVGDIQNPMIYGTNLAKNANIVVVTVQYRLNLFGWLSHPALRTGDPVNDSGNYGLLDLMQALKFIKSNIAHFGGDPDNVTISGQSAGSANVNALMVSPLAAGLFHKAMPISGGLSTSKVSAAEAKANAVIDAFLIKDGYATDSTSAAIFRGNQTNAWIKNYLMSKTTDDIVNIQMDPKGGKFGNGAYTAVGSVVANIGDGFVLPSDYAGAVTSGKFNNVPLLISNTAEEGKLFTQSAFKISDAVRYDMMIDFNPNAPSTLTLADLLDPAVINPLTAENYTAYSFNNPNNVSPGPAITTVAFVASIDATTARYKTVQDKVYAYQFNWAQQPAPWDVIYGAVHAGDIPFIFGDFGKGLFSCGFSRANKPGRLELSSVMQKSIAAFVRTGNPNNHSLGIHWEKANNGSTGKPKKIVFDADKTRLKISTTND